LGYLNEKSYLVRSKFGELRYRQSFLDITSKNSSSNPQKSNDNYGIMISTSDAGSIPTGVEKMLLDIKTSSVVDMLIEKK
ncbi:MAG: hypothetical protein U9Q38_09365, partial [Thermodesulfobacteriota bacterium]|nr:hypothetical protein [Thermodesulfobacteriota bacterium]